MKKKEQEKTLSAKTQERLKGVGRQNENLDLSKINSGEFDLNLLEGLSDADFEQAVKELLSQERGIDWEKAAKGTLGDAILLFKKGAEIAGKGFHSTKDIFKEHKTEMTVAILAFYLLGGHVTIGASAALWVGNKVRTFFKEGGAEKIKGVWEMFKKEPRMRGQMIWNFINAGTRTFGGKTLVDGVVFGINRIGKKFGKDLFSDSDAARAYETRARRKEFAGTVEEFAQAQQEAGVQELFNKREKRKETRNQLVKEMGVVKREMGVANIEEARKKFKADDERLQLLETKLALFLQEYKDSREFTEFSKAVHSYRSKVHEVLGKGTRGKERGAAGTLSQEETKYFTSIHRKYLLKGCKEVVDADDVTRTAAEKSVDQFIQLKIGVTTFAKDAFNLVITLGGGASGQHQEAAMVRAGVYQAFAGVEARQNAKTYYERLVTSAQAGVIQKEIDLCSRDLKSSQLGPEKKKQLEEKKKRLVQELARALRYEKTQDEGIFAKEALIQKRVAETAVTTAKDLVGQGEAKGKKGLQKFAPIAAAWSKGMTFVGIAHPIFGEAQPKPLDHDQAEGIVSFFQHGIVQNVENGKIWDATKEAGLFAFTNFKESAIQRIQGIGKTFERARCLGKFLWDKLDTPGSLVGGAHAAELPGDIDLSALSASERRQLLEQRINNDSVLQELQKRILKEKSGSKNHHELVDEWNKRKQEIQNQFNAELQADALAAHNREVSEKARQSREELRIYEEALAKYEKQGGGSEGKRLEDLTQQELTARLEDAENRLRALRGSGQITPEQTNAILQNRIEAGIEGEAKILGLNEETTQTFIDKRTEVRGLHKEDLEKDPRIKPHLNETLAAKPLAEAEVDIRHAETKRRLEANPLYQNLTPESKTFIEQGLNDIYAIWGMNRIGKSITQDQFNQRCDLVIQFLEKQYGDLFAQFPDLAERKARAKSEGWIALQEALGNQQGTALFPKTGEVILKRPEAVSHAQETIIWLLLGKPKPPLPPELELVSEFKTPDQVTSDLELLQGVKEQEQIHSKVTSQRVEGLPNVNFNTTSEAVKKQMEMIKVASDAIGGNVNPDESFVYAGERGKISLAEAVDLMKKGELKLSDTRALELVDQDGASHRYSFHGSDTEGSLILGGQARNGEAAPQMKLEWGTTGEGENATKDYTLTMFGLGEKGDQQLEFYIHGAKGGGLAMKELPPDVVDMLKDPKLNRDTAQKILLQVLAGGNLDKNVEVGSIGMKFGGNHVEFNGLVKDENGYHANELSIGVPWGGVKGEFQVQYLENGQCSLKLGGLSIAGEGLPGNKVLENLMAGKITNFEDLMGDVQRAMGPDAKLSLTIDGTQLSDNIVAGSKEMGMIKAATETLFTQVPGFKQKLEITDFVGFMKEIQAAHSGVSTKDRSTAMSEMMGSLKDVQPNEQGIASVVGPDGKTYELKMSNGVVMEDNGYRDAYLADWLKKHPEAIVGKAAKGDAMRHIINTVAEAATGKTATELAENAKDHLVIALLEAHLPELMAKHGWTIEAGVMDQQVIENIMMRVGKDEKIRITLTRGFGEHEGEAKTAVGLKFGAGHLSAETGIAGINEGQGKAMTEADYGEMTALLQQQFRMKGMRIRVDGVLGAMVLTNAEGSVKLGEIAVPVINEDTGERFFQIVPIVGAKLTADGSMHLGTQVDWKVAVEGALSKTLEEGKEGSGQLMRLDGLEIVPKVKGEVAIHLGKGEDGRTSVDDPTLTLGAERGPVGANKVWAGFQTRLGNMRARLSGMFDFAKNPQESGTVERSTLRAEVDIPVSGDVLLTPSVSHSKDASGNTITSVDMRATVAGGVLEGTTVDVGITQDSAPNGENVPKSMSSFRAALTKADVAPGIDVGGSLQTGAAGTVAKVNLQFKDPIRAIRGLFKKKQ